MRVQRPALALLPPSRGFGLRRLRLCRGRWRRGGRNLRMKRLDELPGFVIRKAQQCSPLHRVQRGRGKNRRGHRQSVRNQIFDQCDRQGPARHRPRRSSAQILIDRSSPDLRAERPQGRRSIAGASARMVSRACATIGLSLSGPARATRSTSWRHRTAASCRSPAGWLNTVSRRSSKRTFQPNPSDAQATGSSRAFTLR